MPFKLKVYEIINLQSILIILAGKLSQGEEGLLNILRDYAFPFELSNTNSILFYAVEYPSHYCLIIHYL